MRLATIAYAVVLSAFVPVAAAQQAYHPIESGNDLLRECPYFWSPDVHKADENMTDFTNRVMDMAECAGFFDGFFQTIALSRGIDRTTPLAAFCMPVEHDGRTAIETGQVIRITKKWMDENPDQTHKAATWIIRRALMKAFPCGRGK